VIPPELVKLLAVAVRSQLFLVGLHDPLEPGAPLGLLAAEFVSRMTTADWFTFQAWRAALGLTPLSKR
jgi:hypothetical protein